MPTKSRFQIHLEWLDEIRQVLRRQGVRAVSCWGPTTPAGDLAAELRGIADAVEESAAELRDIADALDHHEHTIENEMHTTGDNNA